MKQAADTERPIVIIQPHLRYGGAERQTVLLANSLVAAGQPCTIILHDLDGGLLKDLDSRVVVRSLEMPGHSRVPLAAKKLRRELEQLPPSFVIVKLWSSIMATALVDRRVSKHVYNYCEDLDPTDHAEYIRFGRLKQRIIRSIFRNREIVTANTQQVARSMVDVYGLEKLPPVISSAVDVEQVQRRAGLPEAPRADRRADALNIVTVGSLVERKGLKVIWAGLEEANVAARWHVVGEGPLDEWLASISHPLVDVVAYGGHANPYGIMQDCDLLVHGASSEAFGIVILESLAVSTPVLAARAIGPAEMVETLGDAPEWLLLFDVNEPTQLANAIGRRADALSEGDAVESSVSGATYAHPYALTFTVDKWRERARGNLD